MCNKGAVSLVIAKTIFEIGSPASSSIEYRAGVGNRVVDLTNQLAHQFCHSFLVKLSQMY